MRTTKVAYSQTQTEMPVQSRNTRQSLAKEALTQMAYEGYFQMRRFPMG